MAAVGGGHAPREDVTSGHVTRDSEHDTGRPRDRGPPPRPCHRGLRGQELQDQEDGGGWLRPRLLQVRRGKFYKNYL